MRVWYLYKRYTWKNRVSVADADGVFGKVMMMMLMLSWMLLTHIGTGQQPAAWEERKRRKREEMWCAVFGFADGED